MRRSTTWRAVQLGAAMFLGWLAVGCGGGGADDPFRLFRKIILDSLHRGQGTLEPGGRPILFGPFPGGGADDATALHLRLSCLSGPGLVQARLWHDDPAGGLTPADEAFGFDEDLVDLNLGPAPLDTTIGHFTQPFLSSGIFLEVRLVDGRPVTEVRLEVTPTSVPLEQCFDIEPNNTPDEAEAIEAPPAGPSPSALNPLFGDTVDYFRLLPTGLGDGLEVEVVEPAGGSVVVEATDDAGTVLGGETGPTVNVTPLLGDIPLVGRLFRTRSPGEERQALLVLIQPRIIDGAE